MTSRSKLTNLESYKTLGYLNLEILDPSKKLITLDRNKHICYFPMEKHKHILHSESYHLNSLTDLIVEIGNSLEWDNKVKDSTLQDIYEKIIGKDKKLKQILENMEYLKSSLNKINSFEKTLITLVNKIEAITQKQPQQLLEQIKKQSN